MATRIVAEINQLDPPGRFLTEDDSFSSRGDNISGSSSNNNCDNGNGGIHPTILAKRWICVEHDRAMAKIMHRLREKEETGGGVMSAEEVEGVAAKGVDGYDGVSASISEDQLLPTSSCNLVGLKEWMEHALESINVASPSSLLPTGSRRSLALTSNSYLLSALKIALSLANQICDSEEEQKGRSGEACNNDRQVVSLLPCPGADWSDRVVIHCKGTAGLPQQLLQPLPKIL